MHFELRKIAAYLGYENLTFKSEKMIGNGGAQNLAKLSLSDHHIPMRVMVENYARKRTFKNACLFNFNSTYSTLMGKKKARIIGPLKKETLRELFGVFTGFSSAGRLA
jgi:hypothetical protein